MESDLLIRHEEVGDDGENEISRKWRNVLFWDVVDPNEVILDPNEVLLKRPSVKGKHDPRSDGPSKDLKNQDQQAVRRLKIGMISFKLMDYWRAPDSDVCYVCGQDDHPEQFCPYNYIYGLYDLDTCKSDCLPGKHMMTSMDCGKFLRRVIRVNNMPPSFCTLDLLELFKLSGPLLMCDVPMVSPGVCRAYGVVIFKERGDGERAIDKLNGYLVGDNKLRVDWAYPFVPSGSKASPFISMIPACRRREKRHIAPTTKTMTKMILKKQPWLRGGGKQRAADFLFPKIRRFCVSHKPQRRNSLEEQKGDFFISDIVANNETGDGRNETNLETGAIRDFWRDPDAKFCSICGDEDQEHVDLTCPYNYLCPASYAPCKARLLLWQNETTDDRCFGRPEEAPILDEVTLRRLKFLRCFVRVNNLPKQCCLEQLVGLFIRFGPLRGWYVASDSCGMCSGFGYMIFQHRAHAEEAIEMLNCHVFDDCKLRVDLAYPCA